MHSQFCERVTPRSERALTVPVLLTVASQGQGTDELVSVIDAHQQYLAASGEGARRTAAGRRQELADALREALADRVDQALRNGPIGAIVSQLERGEIDPYAALARVLAEPALLRAVLAVPERGAP